MQYKFAPGDIVVLQDSNGMIARVGTLAEVVAYPSESEYQKDKDWLNVRWLRENRQADGNYEPGRFRHVQEETKMTERDNGAMRTFQTGATRSQDADKPDYEGYLSPLAIQAFGRYMTKHRRQADGQLRDSDNWQRGIPLDSYMKSLLRHVTALWLHHRGFGAHAPEALDDALAGVMFNVQGYMHERERQAMQWPQAGMMAVANADTKAQWSPLN